MKIHQIDAKMAENRGKTPENGAFSGSECRILALLDAEIRVRKPESGPSILEGYAAKFGVLSQDLGGFREKIDPSAFGEALKSSDVRGLMNHDINLVLGRTKSGTMRLSTDEIGLRYEIDLPDTSLGRDLPELIRRGDIDGSSFSFTLAEGGDSWEESRGGIIRTLRTVKALYEVGPVTSPAYLETTVAVRSLQARESESRLCHQRQRLRALSLSYPYLVKG